MARRLRGSHSGLKSRKHHNLPPDKYSLAFDGVGDDVHWGKNFNDGTPAVSSTAYLWRLKNSIHYNSGYQNYDWTTYFSDYGETEMAVAFWVYPDPTENPSNIPVHNPSVNVWKSIWRTDDRGLTDNSNPRGIEVSIYYDTITQKNYFAMAKYGRAPGAAGAAIRCGQTTPVADATTNYSPQWFHVVCSWNSCDQYNDWKMWVNGVEQVNAFDSSNAGYAVGELNQTTYAPGNLHNTHQIGGGFGSYDSTYIAMKLADFSYWHAPLDDNDASALWNNGILIGRGEPTADITSTW